MVSSIQAHGHFQIRKYHIWTYTTQLNDFLDVPPLFLLHCFLNLFHKPPVDSYLSLDLPSLLTFKYSALYFPCHLPDQQEKIKPNIFWVYLWYSIRCFQITFYFCIKTCLSVEPFISKWVPLTNLFSFSHSNLSQVTWKSKADWQTFYYTCTQN